jgi:ABC-type glycerol-3-phosphate transport system substrate-binding protein
MNNKNINRREFLRIVATGAMSTALAACGINPPQEASTPESSTEIVATSIPPSTQPLQLECWIHRGDPQASAIESYVQRYNKELAEKGEPVTWVTTVQPSVIEPLTAAFSAGSGFPDLMIDSTGEWMGPFIKSGWQVELNSLLESVGFDWGQMLPNTRWQIDGKDYFLHYNITAFLMYINLDHANEAGLDLAKSPPDTWDAVVEWAQKMTKTDSNGNIVRPGFLNLGSGIHPAVIWATLVEGYGGNVITPDGKGPNFNNEAGIKAAQWVLDTFHRWKISDINMQDRYKQWVSGAASMFFSGNWVIANSIQQEGLNFDVWSVPRADRIYSTCANESIQIFKGEENRMKEAAKLTKWFIDHNGEYSAPFGDIAVTKAAVEHPDYKNRVANKYTWPVMEAYDQAYVYPWPMHPQGPLFLPYSGEVIIRNMDLIWQGQISIEEGLKNFEKEVIDILAQEPIIPITVV